MNQEEQKILKKALAEWVMDEDAVEFCIELAKLVHFWDDLIDKDKEIESSRINEAFLSALVKIPLNPFYHNNALALGPILMDAFLKWRDSDTMERFGTDSDLDMAFMLRASLFDVFVFCAMLVGGAEWAQVAGPQIRRLYIEKLDDYKKEMMRCRMSEPE